MTNKRKGRIPVNKKLDERIPLIKAVLAKYPNISFKELGNHLGVNKGRARQVLLDAGIDKPKARRKNSIEKSDDMLSKSKEEFLENSGWSSHLFFPTAKKLIDALQEEGFTIDFGRTVVHLIKGTKKLKIYVHHNGKNNEYLTITDSSGIELKTFHYTNKMEDIFEFIKNQ